MQTAGVVAMHLLRIPPVCGFFCAQYRQARLPFFGGFDAANAANFGFAILSDIETFFLLEAAQSDQDTGTLFNGRRVSIQNSSGASSQTNGNSGGTNGATTVQLPTFEFSNVTTTVSVPDGGTILLGGIKQLQRPQFQPGVPLIGQMVYIKRLFVNNGIGQQTESLMLMVTPRIIIQEEEE